MDLVQMNGNLDLTLDLDDFNEFITGSYFALSDDNQTTNQSLEDSNTVSGSVISFDGSLLANAGIEARNYDTGITFTGRTDGSGKFLFDECELGKMEFYGFTSGWLYLSPARGLRTLRFGVNRLIGDANEFGSSTSKPHWPSYIFRCQRLLSGNPS